MKELKRIEPQPEINEKHAIKNIEWLSQSLNNGLNPEGVDPIIRLLIGKINDLTDEVNELKEILKNK